MRSMSSLPAGAVSAASKLARVADGAKEESVAAYRARLSPAQFLVLREKATEPGHVVNRANGGFDDVRAADRSTAMVNSGGRVELEVA